MHFLNFEMVGMQLSEFRIDYALSSDLVYTKQFLCFPLRTLFV